MLPQELISPIHVEDLRADDRYIALGQKIQQTHPDYLNLKWSQDVAETCLELLKTTRDLELGMIFSLAMLKGKDGLSGPDALSSWADSLDILRCWINEDKIWVSLLPVPLVARTSLFTQFSDEYATDGPFVFIRTLEELPLASVGDKLTKTLRDAKEGRRQAVSTSIRSSPAEFLTKIAEPLRKCKTNFVDLCNSITKRVELQQIPDEKKAKQLERIKETRSGLVDGVIQKMLDLLQSETSRSEEKVSKDSHRDTDVSAESSAFEIKTASEALSYLMGINAYYDKNQPSSPIRFFVSHACALVNQDFVSIIKKLFGDSNLPEAGKVLGSVALAQTQEKPQTEDAKEISSEAQATAALDAVRAYYLEREPSSPVPELLGKAREFVATDFRKAAETLFGDQIIKKLEAWPGQPKS